MRMPYWLLKLLPLFDYICPKCKKEVPKNSHKCPHCDERYPMPVRVPPRILKDPKALEDYVHKEIFPRVSVSEQEYLARFFTELFADGFELSNYNAWTGTYMDAGTTLAVSNDIAHHGVYSSKRTISSDLYKEAFAWIALPATYPSLYGRVYWYASAASVALGTGAENEIGVMAFDSVALGWIGYAMAKGTGTGSVWTMGYRNAGAWNSAASTKPVQGDRWTCIEMKLVVGGGGTGKQSLYIDGEHVVTAAGITNNDRGDIKDFLAHADALGVNGVIDYVDCCVCGDAYIGQEKPLFLHLKGQGGDRTSKSSFIQRRTRSPHY